jgi:hypothetical protein
MSTWSLRHAEPIIWAQSFEMWSYSLLRSRRRVFVCSVSTIDLSLSRIRPYIRITCQFLWNVWQIDMMRSRSNESMDLLDYRAERSWLDLVPVSPPDSKSSQTPLFWLDLSVDNASGAVRLRRLTSKSIWRSLPSSRPIFSMSLASLLFIISVVYPAHVFNAVFCTLWMTKLNFAIVLAFLGENFLKQRQINSTFNM